MGFLPRLGRDKGRPTDPDGIYFYVRCDHCGEKLRIRADRRHDLLEDYQTGTLVWKKEIMDSRCFRIMYATVVFGPGLRVQSQTVEGSGHFISQEEFER